MREINIELLKFGKLIWEEMQEQGYNKKSFAKASGLDRYQVHSIISGRHYTTRTLLKALGVLNVHLIIIQN